MADVAQGYFYNEDGQRVPVEFTDTVARETGAANTNKIDEIEKHILTLEDEVLTYDEQQHQDIYAGRNLLEVYDAEIANGYANAWEWLADHVSLRKSIGRKAYKGLRVEDYIPCTIESNTYNQRIMGLDCDEGTTDIEQPPGIFMFPDKVMPTGYQWNTSNNNNGNATNQAPYMVSNIRNVLLNTILPKYPSEIRAVMGERRTLLEYRYTAGQTLTDSNSWGWQDLGRLWLLDETEVYGQRVWSSVRANGISNQFELFRNPKNRILRDPDGERRNWWLRSVTSGPSTTACYVTHDGNANSNYCSHSWFVAAGFKVVGE